jgi:UDP-N-acetylmuramate--alanine ligase
MSISQTKAHFIGVGGIGMSALAELFHNLGATVSGSDQSKNDQTDHLQSKGIKVQIGHCVSHVTEDLNVVVYSSAIPVTNPELVKARELQIPVIQRAEALAEVMRFKRGIAVGGTHGKTTTTSLIGSIFLKADFDPTIAVGGRLKLIESTARLGQGPWMVAEADESDGSFARLHPEISIITNIDNDHLDHYGDFPTLQQAFLNFALDIPYFGCSVVYGDDPKTRELFQGFPKTLFFYGESEDNDFVLQTSEQGYQVWHNDQVLGALKLSVPGKHNALNALAACIATHQAGVPWDICFAGANEYSGVDRRFQQIGDVRGISIYDDYAHHPTEIAATIEAARSLVTTGQFHLIYQPHRYSRTRDCWDAYKSCFAGTNHLYLVDIYPAGEIPLEGVSSKNLAQQIHVSCQYCPDEALLLKSVVNRVKPGDIIMTMGAGQIWKVAHLLVEKLSENQP